MKKILFLFLLIFYFSFCENYYVSPSGDDKNPGTKEKPFRTIQKAAGIVNPGDTIFILPGEYDEKVDILRSGEKDKYIKFKGEGNREEIKVKGFQIGSWDPRKANYIIIENLYITGGVGISGDYCIIQNCIFENYGVGISSHPTSHPPSTGCIVRNNIMRNFGKVVLNCTGTKSTNCIFENNVIYNGEGDVWRIFGKGHIIRNNEVYDLKETGWHADIFQIYDNNREISYDILIENNYFHDCTGSIAMLLSYGYSDLRDWTFRNNVFYNIGGVAQIGIPGCKFYNNTFVNCGRNTAGPLLFRFYEKRGDFLTGAHNTRIFNNIFVGGGSAPDSDGIGWYHFADKPKEEINDFQADYNYVTKTPDANYGPKKGFSEKNGINGRDPKFVSIEKKDFHLLSDSPAIDKGFEIKEWQDPKDKDGIKRPQGSSWDIGAYER
ncbi:MAG: right-handed parallel beta-helix repeat-containing protein [bacterium]|nr:right-handed parallel beta-helix repeat-containing protein [bacterium]MDW8163266.1 right-handed parallel beta-helix repeat-containing protein [Candidatus Omnitrophota bacterium]